MSEYRHVERPFLTQLAQLGWTVIDQGEALPHDPTLSRRASFREWMLRGECARQLRAINRTDDGRPWLTERQAEALLDDLLLNAPAGLLPANKYLFHKLTDDLPRADRNELTGEEYVPVKLIDFDHPERNSFVAINQFRIDTAGSTKTSIRPDIVLFVNGLPLVVVECKEANAYTSNPLHDAIEQLQRYSNQREDTHADGLTEGKEELFHFNQLTIVTTGESARVGTITSDEKNYYFWKDIFPEQYQTYAPPLGRAREQETLIQGVLPPATLLDLVRHCILFMEVSKGREVKIVARYQQYRAIGKIVRRLLEGQSPAERSGVVWHTQGSGKSLTMVMLVRKIRTTPALKDYKVLLVNDRTDLEEQLGETAQLTNEPVDYIESSREIREKLTNPSSNIAMVMMHKFLEREPRNLSIVDQALSLAAEPVPVYKAFGVVNPSEKILILIDEAHRTQASDLGNNLFEAFPNATRIAFTGTPLITERHTGHRTTERFGAYIDKYRLQDAVADQATVQILYEGKTADGALRNKGEFDARFEDMIREHTPAEQAAIKRKYGTYDDVLESETMIGEKARDMVRHYLDHIFPNRFKAQVVASSVRAAVRYRHAIGKALDEEAERLAGLPEPDAAHIDEVKRLRVYAVVTSQGTNEPAIVTTTRNEAREHHAVANFKKAFDPAKPETYTAFLVVCDMLLTGFDAPIEQVMYVDKKMKEHNLLQAIARVNRTYKDKSRGYIVDYIGIAHHLKAALQIYGGEAQELLDGFKSIDTEIPTLEARYRRLVQFFEGKGITGIEAFVTQQMRDARAEYELVQACIEQAEDLRFRADFEVYLKALLESMDIVLPHAAAAPYKIPAKRFSYIHAQIKERYKDGTMNLGGVGQKIRKLVDEYLVSLGINPKIPPVELFSAGFEDHLKENADRKAVASEMEHAIRKHIKISWEDDPALYKKLSEKLEELLRKHRDNWEQLALELDDLRTEMRTGREAGRTDGLTVIEAVLYDNIVQLTAAPDALSDEARGLLRSFAIAATAKIHDWVAIENFWEHGHQIRRLEGELYILLYLYGVDGLVASAAQFMTDLLQLAKRRTADILRHGRTDIPT